MIMSSRLLWAPALGVYVTSVVKDLLCSPRPFAPPVTRLSTSFLTPVLNLAHSRRFPSSIRLAPSGVRLPLNSHHQQYLHRPLPLFTRPPALFLRILDIVDQLLHLPRGHYILCL